MAGFKLGKEMKTDRQAELSGVWVDYKGGSKLLIARAGNKNYKKAFAEKVQPHQHLIDSDRMDEDLAGRIWAELYAETVLLGWQGIEQDDNDQPLDYTQENAAALLIEVPDFFRDVKILAADANNYLLAKNETRLKN